MSKWTEFSFMLKPSALGGIGVFATHDLPAGTQVYKGTIKSRRMKIKDIPPVLQKFCIYIDDNDCFCPERFDHIDTSWYMNHADEPTLMPTGDNQLVTTRDIKAGEEITVDYNKLNEPEHLKEEFYRRVG